MENGGDTAVTADSQFDTQAMLQTLVTHMTKLSEDTKQAQSFLKQLIKQDLKNSRKNRKRKKNPSSTVNSGFTMQCAITEDLRTFFQLGADERKSRAEVTRLFTAYIKDNAL